MRSTFMGLETSKRGMFTQQSALYTTGHNISNANTPGYTRQRVNMQPTLGYPGTGLTAPTTPGFIGTGVEAGSVQRIRDSFVDQQFRQESNKLGYWESRSKAISQMEDVLNEPSEFGLAKSLDEFWKSLQDLSVNPENGGARAVVVQRGIAVADSFKYMYNSLSDIQENLGKEIGVAVKDINSILKQIADLNRQIQEVEPNGYMPNDLYDARDILLDQLSSYLPIETKYDETGGRALDIAEGTVTINLKINGNTVELLNGKNGTYTKLNTIPHDPTTEEKIYPTGPIREFQVIKLDRNDNEIGTDPVNINDMTKTIGKLKSLVDSFGYEKDGSIEGLYPKMLENLNTVASAFITAFNTQHKNGHPMPGNAKVDIFFTGNDASNISVNEDLEINPKSLAASSGTNEEGNGVNASELSKLISTPLGKVQEIIGQLGVDGQQAERLKNNTQILRDSVEFNRQSIHSVSLDEEMTNMIKFQQAYNASARMITVVDETLDKIINGMGRVGL